jgi:amino acid transporter
VVRSTGIAFSGTVGIGLFVTSGELIGLSGSAGCVIAYAVAGLIVTAVMRSLSELVSVRPISGALMDYPAVFVDPALGFACGLTYWLVG